ncbi:MAG: DUF4494 family protein, partial [Paludibacteraceae bacterium]|nr:DUF4494 family protein [Paludibacteraceae bacterium]
IAELIFREDDLCEEWFYVKIKITVVDESRGTERLVPQTLLVRGESVEDALKRFKEAFKDSMSDYIITSISASPILEYFKYELNGTSVASKDSAPL